MRSRALWLLIAMLSGAAVAQSPRRWMASFVVASVPADPHDVTCSEPCETPGLMTVDTTPWTKVLIDGKPVGTTPLFRARLPAGHHTVRFVNEDEGIDDQRSWDIGGARLMRVKGVFATAGESAFEQLPMKAVPASCDECVEAGPDAAHLTVDTEPWGFVYVDRRRVGSTPLFQLPIAAGLHEVMVVSFDGAEVWKRHVAFVPNAVKRLAAKGGGQLELRE